MRVALLLSALVAALACDRSTELIDDGTIPGLLSIELSPTQPQVDIVDVTATSTVEFAARGIFDDGSQRDITDEVEWHVDDDFYGAFVAPGRWQSTNRAGGAVAVSARAGLIEAATSIEVYFRPMLNDPSFPVPAADRNLFDSATSLVEGDPASSPALAYPSRRTRVPLDIASTLFQFERGDLADRFRLRFRSQYLDMTVFTTNDRWAAASAEWDYIGRTAIGDDVEITIDGIAVADPTTLYRSDVVAIAISSRPLDAPIRYWSSSAEGIMTTSVSSPAPARFYPDSDTTTCVGCHAVARDGRSMAVGYDGDTLRTVSLPDLSIQIGDGAGYKTGWSAFSPNGDLLLVADKGTLDLLDARTGQPTGADVDLGSGDFTHPDWSPGGEFIALAQCENADNNRDVDRCSIVRVAVQGTQLANLEVLVEAAGGADNNYFPRYSPDGNWIAYVNSDGKSRQQKRAALLVIPAEGGTPLQLTVASQRVGRSDGDVETGSTMPSWAPTAAGEPMWLAFVSTRRYGLVADDGVSQLWLAAFDAASAASGEDPGFAALWLPGQEIGERNHLPVWTLEPVVSD